MDLECDNLGKFLERGATRLELERKDFSWHIINEVRRSGI